MSLSFSRCVDAPIQPPTSQSAAYKSELDCEVQVVFQGRRWTGLTRRDMLRVPGSLPAKLFAPDSQFMGGSTTVRQVAGGGWEWHVAGDKVNATAVHAVVKFLTTGKLSDEWLEKPGVAEIAKRWKMGDMRTS